MIRKNVCANISSANNEAKMRRYPKKPSKLLTAKTEKGNFH
jgi:hypothetical protein